MRQVLMAAMAAAALLGGAAAAQAATTPSYAPGTSQEQAEYYTACVRVAPALKSGCACRAAAAMKYSPQLRADIILSMSNPAKYAVRAQAVTHQEMTEWETFSADTAKQCGIDN